MHTQNKPPQQYYHMECAHVSHVITSGTHTFRKGPPGTQEDKGLQYATNGTWIKFKFLNLALMSQDNPTQSI